MDKIRIVVADDHAILRDGIRSLLNAHGDMEVVGEAADGNEALQKVAELNPDVIIMDIDMPGFDGIEATRRILRKNPKARVIILAQNSNREYIVSAIKAGAAAYLPKQAMGSELVSAIHSVHQSGSFMYPSAAAEIIKEYMEGAREDSYQLLTDKEKEVLKLLAEGRTSREIGALLLVSPNTVNGHRLEIMKKLELRNRTELIKYAIRRGLVSMDNIGPAP